jgi:hypothetical protein
VGGISLKELNALELELLFMIGWKLSCEQEKLQRYYVNLIEQHKGFVRMTEVKRVHTPPPETEDSIKRVRVDYTVQDSGYACSPRIPATAPLKGMDVVTLH